MTIWTPDPTRLERPVYLSLADQIARAIDDGSLPPGHRLLPHRQLADQLGLSVQTVSRAYEELVRRRLVSGEIGRGTFVRVPQTEPDPPYVPERVGKLVDLSVLKPVCEQMHLTRLQDALRALGRNLPAASALSFRPTGIFPRHRAVAVDWLGRCGLEARPENVLITNGATPALTTALMCVTPPGATLATETVGHHTLVPLASYLGITLKGIAVDSEGMLPEALERACNDSAIRAVFLQPSVINPRAALMSATRRAALAEIAARHDLTIIENDILGPLVDEGIAPIASLAPERTFYITTLTKVTVPGLRVGYMVTPPRFVAAAANRHLVSNWMATPIMVEIASRWIEDGTASELVDWQRAAVRRRHAIAAAELDGVTFRAHRCSLHIWLDLPEGLSEGSFVTRARARDVAIAPSASFRALPNDTASAARISLGSTREDELTAGLRVIRDLLRNEPDLLTFPI